jgi:hypothetical protein
MLTAASTIVSMARGMIVTRLSPANPRTMTDDKLSQGDVRMKSVS